MSEKPITKAETREIVENQTDSITQLINPSDLVHQDIDSWEQVDMDRLKEELSVNLDEWSYQASHPYEGLIQELAASLMTEKMLRVPSEHLVFGDNPDKCVREGYWLHSWDNRRVLDLIHQNKADIEYFHEYEQEAQMFIESCVVDAQVQELE